MRHLGRVAASGAGTEMHSRNLAFVLDPNLALVLIRCLDSSLVFFPSKNRSENHVEKQVPGASVQGLGSKRPGSLQNARRQGAHPLQSGL